MNTQQIEQLIEDNKRYKEALDQIANYVRWGIQYRFIASDALEYDKDNIEEQMHFDSDGELIDDYSPAADFAKNERKYKNE